MSDLDREFWCIGIGDRVKGCFVGNIALELAGREKRVRTDLAQVFQTWAEAIELNFAVSLG